MADLTPDLKVYLSWGSIADSFHFLQSLSLSAAFMSSWASQAHAFHQPVCQRLSWLHQWSVPHVHISGAFFSSEWSPDLQCQAAQVAHWIWWWKCLAAWHCRSVWSLPCHFAGGLALTMAKSHWHRALCSAHKSCTRAHLSWKRSGGKKELVAAPWTSSRRFSHVLWLKVHSRRLLRACLLGSKRKLPPPACQVRFGLPYVVCRPRSMQIPRTLYICNQGPLSSAWSHCIFLCTQFLQQLQKMLLLPTPLRQTAHGNPPELCRRSRPVPQIMIFVFPVFTLTLSSIASFQVKSLLTQSSSDSAMLIRSSALRFSQGTPEWNSRDKASSTIMESSGLSTEPWWTPTFTSNSSLYPSPTRTRLRALAYIHCTSRTFHSSTPGFLSAHQMTFWGTRTPSPGLQKPCRVSCWQLDTSLAAAWLQRFVFVCIAKEVI